MPQSMTTANALFESTGPPPAELENHSEDKCIDAEHQQRLNETPQKTEQGTSRPRVDGSLNQLNQQIPVLADELYA